MLIHDGLYAPPQIIVLFGQNYWTSGFFMPYTKDIKRERDESSLEISLLDKLT